MHQATVFLLTFLVCVLPIIECLPATCNGCTLKSGKCVQFNEKWVEKNGPGCFEKQCLKQGQYGWRTAVTASRCTDDKGKCVDPSNTWISKKGPQCFKNTCLLTGQNGIQVQIVSTAC